MESGFISLAVEDGNFGIGRDVNDGGFWLDANTHAKHGLKLAGRSRERDDRTGIRDAKHAARLALILDEVASAETKESVHG